MRGTVILGSTAQKELQASHDTNSFLSVIMDYL